VPAAPSSAQLTTNVEALLEFVATRTVPPVAGDGVTVVSLTAFQSASTVTTAESAFALTSETTFAVEPVSVPVLPTPSDVR
jgi:hypothetical protein